MQRLILGIILGKLPTPRHRTELVDAENSDLAELDFNAQYYLI